MLVVDCNFLAGVPLQTALSCNEGCCILAGFVATVTCDGHLHQSCFGDGYGVFVAERNRPQFGNFMQVHFADQSAFFVDLDVEVVGKQVVRQAGIQDR